MISTRVALVALVLVALAAAGCSTHNTTLLDRGAGKVIYRVSEEQAFTMVLAAYAEILPKQSLYDIVDGSRRGYESTWRFGLDTYSQKVFVIPAVGSDAGGREVRGYWIEVSGSGSSGSGHSKNVDLFRRLRDALDATGTAVVVTGLKETRYETDGSAYRAGGRDAREVVAPGSRRPTGGPADQLRELKTMRDQGLISDQEYEAKRRQILDRM